MKADFSEWAKWAPLNASRALGIKIRILGADQKTAGSESRLFHVKSSEWKQKYRHRSHLVPEHRCLDTDTKWCCVMKCLCWFTFLLCKVFVKGKFQKPIALMMSRTWIVTKPVFAKYKFSSLFQAQSRYCVSLATHMQKPENNSSLRQKNTTVITIYRRIRMVKNGED